MTYRGDRTHGGPVVGSVENSAHHADWDGFLARTAGGDLVQSAAWGRVKRAAGMETHRVLVRQRDELAGGVQLLVRRFGSLGAVAYAPFGPVVAPQAPDDVFTVLVEQLLREVRRKRIRALFVQPPENGDRVATALRSSGFRPTVVGVAPSATLRIDVQANPEQLLERMSKHARREFRQSLREPVTVRKACRHDLGSFYELYCCTAARHAFPPLSYRYVSSLWEELHPLGWVEIFLAEVDGVDVAANMVTSFSGVVTGRLLGFDPARLSRRLRPNEALIWEIIRWAAETGAKALDVGGVDRPEALALSTGAAQHKTRLGGTPILYPEPLQLIPNPVLRSGFRAVRSSQLLRRFESRWRTDSSVKSNS